MKLEREQAKLKPEFKVADKFLKTEDVDTQFNVKQMEEIIALRNQPIEKHIKAALKRQN